jgi:hypothetical protein
MSSDHLLRELAGLVEKIVTVLESGEPAPSSCTNCPVCALLALLRGERPELAVTFADRAAGVLAALRALVEELPDPPAQEGEHDRAGRPRVQRIPVARA